MKCSQLKIKAMKSKPKGDVIEYKKQLNLVLELKKRCKKGLVRTILIDFSKVYDCLPHDLLIAKLDAYGLDKPSLNLVNGYLRFRTQR